MQLVENKRPTQFLIAEISAIRNFILLALSGAEGSAAKHACHLPAPRRAGTDLASVLPAPPSPPFGAASTRQASGDRTSTALGKGRTFQVANRQAPRKLEFQLSVLPSATSKFLIDNFKRLLPTFRSHSSIAIGQHAHSSGAPSFAACAKSGVFPIAKPHVARKLEFRLTVLPSVTSKFLIDNFKRLLPTFRSHSSITIQQHANSSGAPSFAACAKGGVFPIAKPDTARKLEFRLNAFPSATSKFLIDNFKRDLAFVPANYPNESPA